MAEFSTQPCRIGNSFPHFRMWSLALHALIRNSALEAPRRFAGDKTEFRELTVGVFDYAEVHRAVAHSTAATTTDKTRPAPARKAFANQPAARTIQPGKAAKRPWDADRPSP